MRISLKGEGHVGPAPERKISATILDFAAPVIDPLVQQGLPIATLNNLFQIIITIWNAHVMATPTWGQPEILANLRNMVAGPGAPPELATLFVVLSERRKGLFADDPRAVGEWSVIPDKAEVFRLRCDARMPAGKSPR